MGRRGKETYDRLVIGAGLFGVFAASLYRQAGLRVAVVDVDVGPLLRASLVNQARVHNGYHYPRSVETAAKTAMYYEKFTGDFASCINGEFRQVYAVARSQSAMSPEGFLKFCHHVGIPVRETDPTGLFVPGTVTAAFETRESSFDPSLVRRTLLARVGRLGAPDWYFESFVESVDVDADGYDVHLRGGRTLRAGEVLNAGYAGLNQVLAVFGCDPVPLKYELCEVILVDVRGALERTGLTVVDGAYCSLMPFGLSGKHSLTAVDFTPHLSSDEALPRFPCQAEVTDCGDAGLANCARCPARPASAWPHMRQLARRYVAASDLIDYSESLFAVKAVLQAAEIDDARPTLVLTHRERPAFRSVFGGKVSTIYDLEELL